MRNRASVIYGDKIILRPITLNDEELILKWRNDPSVKSNFIFREELTREVHEKWMKQKVETGEVIQFIIEEKIGDHEIPIGSVYLQKVDLQNMNAEYGIFIGETNARGKGYGTECANLILKFAFETLGLHKVYLRVLGDNVIAQRSYMKAGFIKEGRFIDHLKIEGKYHDLIFMAALNN